MSNIAGVILAAGKGSRMKSTTSNKVTLLLGGKPMVVHAFELLRKLNLSPVIIVVGFAKESVQKLIGDGVIYAEQAERLGTAHALEIALKEIPEDINNVLVIQGDDSGFYKEKPLKEMITIHNKNKNALTFLTVELSNPVGLGRIFRDSNGKVMKIIEEKDATNKEREIKEINPACYVFSINFLRKYLPKVEKSSVTGEYYLVSLVEIAIKNNEKIEAVRGGKTLWRGVNTREELDEAERLYRKFNS